MIWMFPTAFVLASGLLSTAAGISPTAQDPEQDAVEQPDFSSAEVGFQIHKPAASWELKTTPATGVIDSLAMGPPDQGGKVQMSIKVTAATTSDVEALRQERDNLLKQIEDMPDVSAGEALELEIAGLPAPGIQVDQESLGTTYRVRQAYLTAQGMRYTFQVHAPLENYAEFEPLFDQALASFAIVPLAGDALHKSHLRALANRCGSEIVQQKSWKTASEQALARGQLIVVAIQALPGFEIDDAIDRGPFMDQDVVRLLQHRFVVLRWRRGMGAPFERPDVFGMSPSTFGVGLLIVTPEGEVVRQVYVLEATAVYDVLLDTLQPLDPLRERTIGARHRRIRFLLHSGQLAEAEAALTSAYSIEDPVQEAWLNAELQRLYRNGAEALSAMERALDAEETLSERDPALRYQLETERAALLMVTGEAQAAEAALDGLLAESGEADSDTVAEALLLKGALRLQAEDITGAETHWNVLVDEHPESRWAWSAAAALTHPAWGLEVYPNLAWPRAEDRRLVSLPAPVEATAPAATLNHMVATAADYLLAAQEEDGSWTPTSAYGDDEPRADDFDIAAAAIAGRALLRLKDRPDGREAASRTLSWLLHQRELLQEQGPLPVLFMDYTVWSRSYAIYFLADCLEAGIGEESALRREIATDLGELIDRQQPNGGWSYYLSGDVDGEAVPQAISFTTATVVLALERAAAVGCPVDADSLERGLLCLETLRSPEGTFAYFLHGRDVSTGQLSGTGPEGSAARGPVCSLALLRGGREDVAALVPRMELYIKHLPAYGVQRRKALMHAGAHTQGSHYLLFDYSTAAEALREAARAGLPDSVAAQVHVAILRELRACRNADGSYVDNPIIGVDIGTGLALNGLLDLARALDQGE